MLEYEFDFSFKIPTEMAKETFKEGKKEGKQEEKEEKRELIFALQTGVITTLMLEETLEGFLQYEIQARPGWGLPTYEVLYVKAYLKSELRKQLSFLAYWKCLKPNMTVNFIQIPFIIYLDKLQFFSFDLIIC